MPLSKDAASADTDTTAATDPAMDGPGPAPATNNAAGNAAIKRQLADGAGGSSGGSGLDALLTKVLGKQATDVITGQISDQEITSWGQSILNAATTSVGHSIQNDLVGRANTPVEALMAQQTAQDVTDNMQARIKEFLATPEGQKLASTIADKLNAAPDAVVGTMLLAAVVTVLSNASIPTLDTSFKVGGNFSVGVTADLYKFRQLAANQLGARLIYKDGPLTASIGGSFMSGTKVGKELTPSASDTQDPLQQFGHQVTVQGPGLTPKHIEQLQATIAYQVNDHLVAKGGSTTDFADGHVVKGTIGGSLSEKLGENESFSLNLQDQYGSYNGAGGGTTRNGVSGSMQFTTRIIPPRDGHGTSGELWGRGTLEPDGHWAVAFGVGIRF